jgi:hypothetical protein
MRAVDGIDAVSAKRAADLSGRASCMRPAAAAILARMDPREPSEQTRLLLARLPTKPARGRSRLWLVVLAFFVVGALAMALVTCDDGGPVQKASASSASP